MYLLEIKNRERVNIVDVPVLNFEDFSNVILNEQRRVVNFFASNDDRTLYLIMAEDKLGKLYVTSTRVGESYPSFTLKRPSLHMFEREIYENTGIKPEGHPFLKPVRDQIGYEFLKSDDYQTHEVAVGPVHAGIIEPGHFRFLCNGESVNHLEIMLGYQKRGVENLVKSKPSMTLAESICGDSTIAYAKTYAECLESLSGIDVDEKSKQIRAIALEMERLAICIGDLGAVAGDVAYQIGANVFGVTRTLVINAMLDICSNRFGKGLIKLGGVHYDIDDDLVSKLRSMLDEVKTRTLTMADAMFSNATVLSRLENVGGVSKKRAKEIGMVGMAARASGVLIDARKFDDADFAVKTLDGGDVYARTYMRYIDALNSINLILQGLDKLSGEIDRNDYEMNLAGNSLVVSINEGWRGEIVHTCITDECGFIRQYKIKDASFNNWFGLALAVRNNQISDFPVCNKSFNLSYCGFDL